MTTTLDIVIVNWNAGIQLRECIASIADAPLQEFTLEKVILVDNGSTDGSLEEVDSGDLPLEIIRNSNNAGFARACNQGARRGSADAILFLNPDVRLFPSSLTLPMRFLNDADNRRAGIVGIQLVAADGSVSQSCARFPNLTTIVEQMLGLDRIFPEYFPGHFMTDWDHRENRRVDQVMGAFFMVRRRLFELLHGFDERFFVYFEDMDFSLRAACLGYESWYLADAAAFHRGCGTSDTARAHRLMYFLRSRILYIYKHFGKHNGNVLLFATMCFEPMARLFVAALRHSTADALDILRGFRMLYREIPSLAGGPDSRGKERSG